MKYVLWRFSLFMNKFKKFCILKEEYLPIHSVFRYIFDISYYKRSKLNLIFTSYTQKITIGMYHRSSSIKVKFYSESKRLYVANYRYTTFGNDDSIW